MDGQFGIVEVENSLYTIPIQRRNNILQGG